MTARVVAQLVDLLPPGTWAAACCAVAGAVVLSALARLVWASYRYARLRERMDRRDALLCVKCGYDLRASPGRCPECGTRVQ